MSLLVIFGIAAGCILAEQLWPDIEISGWCCNCRVRYPAALVVRLLPAAVLFGLTSCSAPPPGKIKINVFRSDEAIRRQLFQLTPLGMSAREVYEILESRLQPDSDTSIGKPAPDESFESFINELRGSAILVQVGHYIPVFTTIVQAIWQFDDRGKLRDIEIRRINTAI